MDGLSLLGMVAEQRLGDQGRECQEHGYSQVVKPEQVKLEVQEEGVGGEFESSTSSIAGREVEQESEAVRDMAEQLRLGNQHFEKSSQSVATHLNIYDFGNFQYKIMENQLCKFSKYTGWHLQRSTGMMKIKLTFRGIRIKGPMMVRAVMVRKEETYRHFGVDRVCDNHRGEVGWDHRDQVLQAASGLEGMWSYGDRGPRRSLCFNVGSASEAGELEETIGLKCICNDSCSTCDDTTFKQTESSRDLLLVLTLESLEYGLILARRSVGVWPKAVVRPKDLTKPERRKPKGGAAKLNKMRELLEQERASQLVPQMAGRQPVIPRRVVSTLGGNVFRIAPKTSTVVARPGGSPGTQTFNILLPVQSSHGIPTTQELMDTTIGLAIKNKNTLGISDEDFIRKIQERLLKEHEAVNEG